MKLSIIILAAGNSRRFGSNKLLYRVGGIPMYRRILQVMTEVKEKTEKRMIRPKEPDRILGTDESERSREGVSCRLCLVTQYDEIKAEAEKTGVVVLINPHPEEGIASSMKIGLRANPDSDACLFAVADQPWLKAGTVCRLIRDYLSSGKGMACLIYKGIPGNPCIFSKKYYPELMKLTGDRGGKRILMKHPQNVAYIEATDGRELLDMDTSPDHSDNFTGNFMIKASKAIPHVVLARKWGHGFMTPHDMRKKWVAVCRRHTFSNDRSGA